MGNAPSSPAPAPAPAPPSPEQVRVADVAAQEAEAQTALEEMDQEIADQKAADAEIDTQAGRDLRRSHALDAAKQARGFKRPSPITKPLSISSSASCATCRLTIDPSLSSATVVLSRNILGKTRPPSAPLPPSNLPSRPTAAGFPSKVPECSKGCWYVVPYRSDDGGKDSPPTDKSVAKGTVLSERSHHWKDNAAAYISEYVEQVAEEKANRLKFLKNSTKDRIVRIWNPSDDPVDKYGSLALNYDNYGALTKLYLKPTIPFQFSFDPTGLSAPPPAPAVRNVAPASGQSLSTPSSAPSVQRPPTL